MTASGSASAASAAATSALLASTKLMETSSSGRSDATRVDEADHGLAVRGRRRPVGDRDEAQRVGHESFRREASTARPDHLETPRSPAESGLARRFRRYARRVSRDGTRVFPGREECLTPPRDGCAAVAARRRDGGAGSVVEQLGSHPPGALDLLLAPPRGDRTVVAREQHGRHVEAAPRRRASCSSGTRAGRPRATPRRGSRGCRRRRARAGRRPRSSPSRRPRRRSARSRRG